MTTLSNENKTKSARVREVVELRSQIEELRSIARQREAAEIALKKSEERYRSVFENTGTATIIIEDDMTISMVNAKFEMLTGYSKDEIEGRMKWTDFVVAEDLEQMKAYHVKRRKDNRAAPTEYECRVFNRYGEVKDMFLRIDMIADSRSSVASFMDITAFKQTEAALMESERKLSKLMGNLPGMAYRCLNDKHRTMKFVSAGCNGLTGYPAYELIDNSNRTFIDLVHPDDRAHVDSQLHEIQAAGRPFQMEYRIVTASGAVKWVWEEGVGIVAEDGELREVEGFISDITEHKMEEQQLRKENIKLKSFIKERYKFGDIIGKNASMQDVYERISKAAATHANVIIYGESGTGKDLVAWEIHRMSDHPDKPFVPVNCSAIPENLFESEFFGYQKGAFTGAVKDKPGYFDLANGGTLFLDELGEIGLAAQVKLLRVIEGGGYTPVGGNAVRHADVRIVAATNRDLKKEVQNGRMREDFFYRIHIIPITLPPLRERKDDLPLLIEHFLNVYKDKGDAPKINGKLLGQLYNYDWPGNVRELQNVLQRFITLKSLDFLTSAVAESDLPMPADAADEGEDFETLNDAVEQFERNMILKQLEANRWHKSKTAEQLGINRKTLFRKMKQYGIF
ncbi:MAG TPA: sigma 54-interacting transcriptional regulator [Desulfosalsimonadaceae bacterium]|nr:sigma 54-interacting transcriptional regulator [Desulfosalsimonadaceae bacterium]